MTPLRKELNKALIQAHAAASVEHSDYIRGMVDGLEKAIKIVSKHEAQHGNKTHKTISRVTLDTLGSAYGPDRGKPLLVQFTKGDLLTIKPLRTQRPETVSLFDVYNYLLRCRVNREVLERARERKAKKAERLARERQKRAEKRLFGNQ